MLIEELKSYARKRTAEQHEYCLDQVDESSLRKIRGVIQDLLEIHPELKGYSDSQFEVLFLELYDKLSSSKQKVSGTQKVSEHCICISSESIDQGMSGILHVSEPEMGWGKAEDPLASLEAKFVEYYEKSKKGDGHRVFFHYRKFYEFCRREYVLPHCIKRENISKFYKEELKKCRSVQSVRVKISNINLVYKFLVENRIDDFISNPFEGFTCQVSEEEAACCAEIPSLEEVLRVMDGLSGESKLVFAIMIVRGFSHNDMKYLHYYSNTFLEDENNALFRCWTDFIYSEEEKAAFYMDPEEFFLLFQLSKSFPWYENLILEKYSDDKNGKKVFADFDRRTFELELKKCVALLKKEGLLENEYSAKAFRNFGVKRIWKKTGHDLQFMQKVLHHGSPAATKLFLKNIGLL